MSSIVPLSLALRRSRGTLTIDLLHCEPTKAYRTILKNVAESSCTVFNYALRISYQVANASSVQPPGT